MSFRSRPRRCSRITYCEIRSSLLERTKRNENGFRSWSRSPIEGRLYPCPMRRKAADGRFAERVVSGFDDQGAEERIVIWIERKPGALWAVGRAVNPQHRSSDAPRPDDYIFEGYELDDALERANETLEDDVRVSSDDGGAADAKPFVRSEILGPLERWFFGRCSRAAAPRGHL